MPKRHTYEIQEKILFILKENPETYARLERKVNTGFRTVKMNCETLKRLGMVKIDRVPKNPANGQESYLLSLTEEGTKAVKKIREEKKK